MFSILKKEDLIDEYEERIAIKIYHGNIPEEEAIKQAKREMREKVDAEAGRKYKG